MALAARLPTLLLAPGLLSRRLPRGLDALAAIAIASVLVALGLWMRLVLSPVIAGVQFLTFLPAAMLATRLGGAPAGLSAVALGVIASSRIILDADLSPEHWAGVGLYVVVAIIDVVVVAALLAGNAALRESTERAARLNDDLQASEARFRDLVESAPDAMVIADRDQQIVLVNAETERMFGYRRAHLIGRSIDVLMPEASRGLHGPLFDNYFEHPRTQRMGEGRELVARAADGSEIPIETNISVLSHGRSGLICAAIRDISSRREAQERQGLLIRELNHRVKNTLASVQAIVTQTLRSAADPQSFSDAFTARLAALSQSHDVLTRNDWSGAFVSEIVTEQLSPYEQSGPVAAANQFSLSGPALKLAPNRAVTLSMAVGELATNAAKYGALSVDSGSVEVEWRVEEREGGRHLVLTWREQGGPPVSPPTRRGFGMRLIERSLTSGLAGSATLTHRVEGLVCDFSFPLQPGES